MTVTLHSAMPCQFCGYRFRVFMMATVRVNRRSLKTTAPSLITTGDRSCPECGWPNEGSPVLRRPFVLDPADAVKVAEYRAKHWGTGAGEVPVERAS